MNGLTHNKKFCRLAGRWPIIALITLLIAGASIIGHRFNSYVQRELPGFLQARLSEAFNRPVEFEAVGFSVRGVRIENLRVGAGPGERADLIQSPSVTAGVDWMHLVGQQELRVSDVHLHAPVVTIDPYAPEQDAPPWQTQLMTLGGSGVGRLAVRDASVRVLGAGSAPDEWTAVDLTGSVSLTADQFGYDGRMKSLEGHGARFTSLRLAGTGNADLLHLTRGSAAYREGRFDVSGTFTTVEHVADLVVKVRRMPLSSIGRELGIPAEWAMQGTMTGEVHVDALGHGIRKVTGTLNVQRGSVTHDGGQLPWKSAVAQVDWTPERARLADVEIVGNGMRLTGEGTITNQPGAPLTAGRLLVAGRLTADTPAAFREAARFLAVDTLPGTAWQADSAAVDFRATGIVGNLDQAQATGRLTVSGLELRQRPDSKPVIISRLEADLFRSGDEVALRNLVARTEDLRLAGHVTLTDRPGNQPAFLRAEASVEVNDLASLKTALPGAQIWNWIPVASADASARLELRMAGPLGDLRSWSSDGEFAAQNFRLSTAAPLPNDVMFFIPVEAATGAFTYAGQRLQIQGLNLETSNFDAGGDVSLDFRTGEPVLAAQLKVSTDDWRGLPAMPQGALSELQDGHLEGELQLEGPYNRLALAPVTGSFRLTDATYTPRGENTLPLPIDALTARFHWEQRVLHLPSLSVESPLLMADATGQIAPENEDYRVVLDINGRMPDAGGFLDRFALDQAMRGGQAETRVNLRALVDDFENATVTGVVSARDFVLAQSIPSLQRDELEVNTLDADFSMSNGQWDFKSLALNSPGLSLALNGQVSYHNMDAHLRLVTDRWAGPVELPVVGGTLALDGRASGDPNLFESLSFTGSVQLDGAEASWRTADAAVLGGTLQADVTGAGLLANWQDWLQSGALRLTNSQARLPNDELRTIERFSGSLARRGDQLILDEVEFLSPGVNLAGGGRWDAGGHSLDLTARVTDPTLLALVGVNLPEGVTAEAYQYAGTLAGNAQDGAALAEGRLTLTNGRLALEGMPVQEFDHLQTDLRWADGRLALPAFSARGPAGVISGSGDWAATRHAFTLDATLRDPARLGIEMPDGLRAALYHLAGTFSGTPADTIAEADLRMTLTDATLEVEGFPAQHLNRLSAAGRYADGRLDLRDLVATNGDGTLTGGGHWTSTGHAFQLSADLTGLAALGFPLPDGLTAERYLVTLTLAGDAEAVLREATGRLEIHALSAALGGLPAQAFDRVTGDFTFAGERLLVQNVEGRGPAGTLTAAGEWSPGSQRLQLAAAGDDFGKLGVALPEGFGMQAYELKLNLTAEPEPGTPARLGGDGTLRLTEAHFPFGPVGPHRLDQVTAAVSVAGNRITFSDIEAEGPAGRFTGTGQVERGEYRLTLDGRNLDLDLVRWIIPGTVRSGQVSGTVSLVGDRDEAVRSAKGSFRMADGVYVVPEELELLGGPIRVSETTGSFHWTPQQALLSNVRLSSDVVDASQTVISIRDGVVVVDGQVRTTDLGRAADYWPALLGLLRGGEGGGALHARFDPNGLRGTLDLTGKGGVLILPGVPDEHVEFRDNPLSTAKVHVAFEPERITLTGVHLRGPKGNADGELVWSHNGGQVYGSGKAWFSREYTKKLLQPTGWRWLASLVGIREVKSGFTVAGTSDEVMLNASITQSLMWRFAKGRVPREFQDIASGKSPLWVKPVEAAPGEPIQVATEQPNAEAAVEPAKSAAAEAGVSGPAARPGADQPDEGTVEGSPED
jgi:hypothetical protein